MLSLTRKTDYALIALSYLGKLREEGSKPVSARHIAEMFGLPQPLLMNILKELCQTKIVTSKRGAQGGYVLAADPNQLSLLEVVTAMEGPLQFAQCAVALPIIGQGCPIAGGCPIKSPIRHLHARINEFLAEVKLQELINSFGEEDPEAMVQIGGVPGEPAQASPAEHTPQRR